MGDSNKIIIGGHSHIRGELMTFGHGGRISIGEWCYVGAGTRIWSAVSIEIGDRVLISHSANIFDSLTHPIQAAARHQQIKQIFESGHPLRVSLDEIRSRLGMMRGSVRAQGLRGVSVGEGTVVTAGAVVTKAVEPYCIVAGNPAVLVREIVAE